MRKTNQIRIIIPQGHFEGRCEDCVHSYRTGQDIGNQNKDNREMYCAIYKRNFFPYDVRETNCSHYKMKIGARIKYIIAIVLIIYALIAIIAVILGI